MRLLNDHQHGACLTQMLHDVAAQFVAHRIRVLTSPLGEQALHAVVLRFTRPFGQLPAVLGFHQSEHAHQIAPDC